MVKHRADDVIIIIILFVYQFEVWNVSNEPKIYNIFKIELLDHHIIKLSLFPCVLWLFVHSFPSEMIKLTEQQTL